MLTEPTLEKLKSLKLDGMADAWVAQQANPKLHELAFDERFGLLVDAEWMHRENRRLKRALDEAKLRLGQACVEDLDYSAKRQLDRAVVRQLATCRWVTEHQQVIITGATGVGKTYIACALAQQACRRGHRAVYRRVSRLFHELRLAQADGTFPRLLARFARMDVLVLDDLLLAPMADADRHGLLEVLEDRYGTRSTILTSQVPPERWHEAIGDPQVADAICDRLIHNAHRLALKGPSRRKEKAPED
jgi:DNA replication protein DnaC